MTKQRGSRKKQYVLRALLSVLTLSVLAFIFINSLQPASASSVQSTAVTDFVQRLAGFFAPRSFIATASGEDYQRLHAYVRIFAHFSEFALLGAMLIWCFAAYSKDKRLFLLALCLLLIFPLIDELLQSFTLGRSATLLDAAIDMLGGFFGAAFAKGTLALAAVWTNKKRRKDK